MPTGSTQKSSIDFLLSGPPAQETVSIAPKTSISSTTPKKRQIIRPKNPQFSLKLIQQPSHAKVSPRPPSRVFPPFSEHRPIHPPPVLQLKVDDFKFQNDTGFLDDDYLDRLHNANDPKSSERIEELKIIKDLRSCKIPAWAHYSTFFVTARLKTVRGQNEKILFNNKSEKSIDDLLIGIKVCSGMPISLRTSSPANSYLKKSLPGEKPKSSNYAIAFVFSDLSVRKIGTFSLKFDLFEVFQGKIYWRSEIFSDNFTVYTPKKFPGSFPSTSLTSFLYKHGARIRQRKRGNNSNSNNNNTKNNTDGLTRKFEDMNDGQDEDSDYSLKKSAPTSMVKSHPSKLAKIHEAPFGLYQQQPHHQHYQSIPAQRPIQYYQQIPVQPSSDRASQQPKLPSVDHFHEPVYVYPPGPPQQQFQRVLPQHLAPPLQQQGGVTYAYQAHDPNQPPTLIQRMPISTGPYYHPSGSMYQQPAMVQQVQQLPQIQPPPLQQVPQVQQLSPQQGGNRQTLSQIQQAQTPINIPQQQHQTHTSSTPLMKPVQNVSKPLPNGYTNYGFGHPSG